MFRITAPDNDLYFFHDRPDVQRCPLCGELTHKWDEDLGAIEIPITLKYDISFSYDGVLLTSSRFRDCVLEAGFSGMAFRALRNGFYGARPTQVVQFDAEARKTKFEDRCSKCGSYKSVTGATPIFLVPGTFVAPGEFARTHLEFGAGDEKTPLIVCGNEVARGLKGKRLRGLEFTAVKQVE